MTANGAEDTFFKVKKFLNCSGRLLDLSTPAVMGILNITPDSFFDGGKNINEVSVMKSVEMMAIDGATIIDIGGQSTRPGADFISPDIEWKRIQNFIPLIAKHFPSLFISVDTFHSDVAEKSLDSGAVIVNDVSGGEIDSHMFKLIANRNVPYIIMHMKGIPANMQKNPTYENVVMEVFQYLAAKVQLLHSIGVNDLIIDPGFGFGKTVEHNFSLLKHLSFFRTLECPILCGLSRKSIILKTLDIKAADALNGTTALNMLALHNGASILRVHDVKEAIQTVKLFLKFTEAE